MPRKLEAQFEGAYLMSSVLITSTMKSEPALPPIRASSLPGVAVSVAMVWNDGGSADGSRGALTGTALAASGAVTAVAAPATATPARNLRRLTSDRSFRAMVFSQYSHARRP